MSLESRLEQRCKRREQLGRCSTPDCTRRAERVGSGLCEACYYRKRRNGSVGYAKRRTGRFVNTAGYVVAYQPFHPLSNKAGTIYEHRLRYAEKHGGELKPCHWCGAALTWKSAIIDHLNENKQDNSHDNLVAACTPCNRARGAMLPFFRRMKSESFPVFVETMKQHVQTTPIESRG